MISTRLRYYTAQDQPGIPAEEVLMAKVNRLNFKIEIKDIYRKPDGMIICWFIPADGRDVNEDPPLVKRRKRKS